MVHVFLCLEVCGRQLQKVMAVSHEWYMKLCQNGSYMNFVISDTKRQEVSPEIKKPRRVETQRLGDLHPDEAKKLLAGDGSENSADRDYVQADKAERLRDLQSRASGKN